jgi:hypothetical protein
MIKNLRWKIPLIVVVIAIGIMILYPPAEKVLKRESVKEIDGKVVDRQVIILNAFDFFGLVHPDFKKGTVVHGIFEPERIFSILKILLQFHVGIHMAADGDVCAAK